MIESGEKTKIKRPSNVQIEKRERISISGVEEVVNISETNLSVITGSGGLTVTGSGMRINKYNADEGFLVVDGAVEGLRYSAVSGKTGGFFKRLFK
jgi:sporulation protein YabP